MYIPLFLSFFLLLFFAEGGGEGGFGGGVDEKMLSQIGCLPFGYFISASETTSKGYLR